MLGLVLLNLLEPHIKEYLEADKVSALLVYTQTTNGLVLRETAVVTQITREVDGSICYLNILNKSHDCLKSEHYLLKEVELE